MSENHAAERSVAQTSAVSVGAFSGMGNLLERDNGQDGAKVTVSSLLPDSVGSATASLFKNEQDYNFKFFGNVTNTTLSSNQVPNIEQSQVLDSEKVILNAFFNEVRNAKPQPLKNWSALQHYVYFIYRHVISPKPCNSNEMFPTIITRKIRELVESLLQEDLVQLCIRLVALIREYAIITRGHFNSFQFQKVTSYLVSLMSYYSAFCSAASKLAPLIPEFDFLIMERFNVNWLFLNRSIFYHYVYMSPCVQNKIPAFIKLKEENKAAHKTLLESYSCFSEDMLLLAAKWTTLRMRISNMSHKRALSNPGKYLLSDWKTFEEYKKILTTNYWIIRNKQAIQTQDMLELDANLLSLMGDTTYMSDFLIDSQGNCMCEDCLAAEFKCNSNNVSTSINSPLHSSQSSSIGRLITCYMCQEPIALDALASHIVTKHYDVTYQKPARVYLTPHQKRLFCPKKMKTGETNKSKDIFPFEGLFEKNSELKESILKIVNGCSQHIPDTSSVKSLNENDELKHKSANYRIDEICHLSKSISFKNGTEEPVFKIASEAPNIQNGTDAGAAFLNASKTNDFDSCTTVKFDSVSKVESENKSSEVDKILNGDSSKKIDVNSLLKPSNGAVVGAVDKVVANGTSDNGAFRKPQPQKVVSSTDTKLAEFLKNSNNQKNTPTAKPSDNSCAGHMCGHKCKQDEKQTEIKKYHSCQDTCEHHKESRKCDCAYCEVFGSTLPVHPQKANETRERLRSRLNQRKEKVGELSNKNSLKSSSLASKLNIASKAGANTSNTSPSSNIESKPPQPTVRSKQDSAPPRVPEVFHPMPPPAKTTSVVSVEQKRKSDPSVQRAARGDIIELLNYIEGNKTVDKAAIAQKKAAKKERQRLKKVEERERIENERKQKEEEEKRKEEERLKAEALAKQLAEKQKNKEDSKRSNKKKGKNSGGGEDVSRRNQEKKPDLIEETIPAMVTIKRIVEDVNSPPTVTITLKGSTPESDKLLYTLVNGHTNKEQVTIVSNDSSKNKKNEKSAEKAIPCKEIETNSSKKKKNKKKEDKQQQQQQKEPRVQVSMKEIKVTIAVDKNNLTTKKNTHKKKNDKTSTLKNVDNMETIQPKSQNSASSESKEDIPFSMLRLPPGITITKIDGPPANKNCKSANDSNSTNGISNSNVSANKSGVIVVDTEKLMQQSVANVSSKKSKKKNKKKKATNKTLENMAVLPLVQETATSNCGSSMVTLKNPIFHNLRNSINNKPPVNKSTEAAASLFPSNQQASIFKNENGMVTIRSPRLQNPFENGSPISNFLSDLKPMFGPEVSSAAYVPVCRTNTFSENSNSASFDAREILSGLPGIEITKVDKSSQKANDFKKSSSQPAEVSIIPTTANSTDKFNFDKEDWTYESVFTPRDEVEDMDAEERELEAFKRFCQQSVPPERKEKVAHLNVKDIVLTKKKDINYS